MASALIPDGLDSHFDQIEGFLNQVLGELKKVGAQRVTSRLNYSNTDRAMAVWAGIVEDQPIQLLRRFDAGKIRFGRSNRSAVYEQAVMDPKGSLIERDWVQSLPEKSKGGYGGDALGPRAGCMYQVFIALKITEGDEFRHGGTLTSAYKQKPNDNDMKTVRSVMEDWAWEEKGRPYVEYLKKTFQLGGPRRPKAGAKP